MRIQKTSTLVLLALLVSNLVFLSSPPSQSAGTLSTTDLIMNVDGTNSSSYSGSGTTWTDLSSSGNNLTIGGGTCAASGPSWSSTEGGGSFLFNTDKNCIKKDSISAAPTNFSLFFWIKPTSLPSSGTFSYLAQIGRNATISNQEYMFGFNSAGQLYFWDYDGGYGFTTVTSNIGSTLVTANEWQYVGFVKSGTSGKFYIGKAGSLTKVGDVTASKSATYVTTSFVIGYDYRDNNNFFKGYVGAVHYYSGAIAESIITNNYSATPRLQRQTISISSLGTSSKTYPYSQALNITTTGSSGTGAKSFAATDGTASGCSLSSTSSATPTLSATTSGTCNVTATIAADATYAEAVSTSQLFTFSKAAQSAITITTTSARYATNLSLATSGGSTGGTPTYNVSSGSCSISGSTLTPTGVGSCVITANLATDSRYLAETSTATTISIANGISTASINFNPGTLYFRQANSVSVTTSSAGRVTFKVNGNYLPGCRKLVVNALNSYSVACSYRPTLHGYVSISATFDPSDSLILGTYSATGRYWVERRTTRR